MFWIVHLHSVWITLSDMKEEAGKGFQIKISVDSDPNCICSY